MRESVGEKRVWHSAVVAAIELVNTFAEETAMSLVTLNCTSGARRADRTAVIKVDGELVTISLRTPSGGGKYPTATVRLEDVMARLDHLDQQERRIPPAEGENDLMIASSDGEVWLWVRAQNRDNGGVDVIIDPTRLRDALAGREIAS